jgi:hypothetical protein
MSQSVPLHFAFAGLVALACGSCEGNTGPDNVPEGLANCQGTAFLTVAPVDAALLREIVPLGNLSPPSHTQPTDHLYMNTTTVSPGVATVANIVAPGDMLITEVSKQTRSGGGPNDGVNYGMKFFPCADVFMYFSHIVTLSPDLTTRVGAITDCDPPSTVGGITSIECNKIIQIRLTAGTLIGTVGGPSFPGVDFGGADRRVPKLAFVNPARSYGNNHNFGQNNTICPVDYFVPAVAGALRARLGRNGTTRTIPPVCGSVMQDVPNTAQGRWFFDNTVQEDPHLALAHDNGDPRLGTISAGTSIPSLPVGARNFTTVTTGRVNLDFPLVTADGQIYCYQNLVFGPPARHVLIQLISATRVRIEGVLGATCGDPATWVFTSGAREFTR